jgi:hypothetical protein
VLKSKRISLAVSVSILLFYSLLLIVTSINLWTSAYSPDSHFYMSLSIFGDKLLQHASVPSYFWTKLSLILPQILLINVFGIWTGISLFKIFLLLLVTFSSFCLAFRLSNSYFLSILIGLSALLNSQVVAFVGDPYFTGSAIAISIAFLTSIFFAITASHFFASYLVGLFAGWLLMLNPTVFFMQTLIGLYISARILRHTSKQKKNILATVTNSLGSFALTSIGFIVLGEQIFKNQSWILTVTRAVLTLKGEDYASRDFVWLSSSTVLLLFLLIFVFQGLVLIINRSFEAKVGFEITFITILIAILIFIVTRGPIFEAAFYLSTLFPSIFCGLIFSLLCTKSETSTPSKTKTYLGQFMFLNIFVFGMIYLGSRMSLQIYPMGVIVLYASTLFCLWSLSGFATGRKNPEISEVRTAAILALLMFFAQFVQSTQPPSEGLLGRWPFYYGFIDSGQLAKQKKWVEIESWVLENLDSNQKTLVWLEPESGLIEPAAFHLWGPNATQTPANPLDWQAANLLNLKPGSVITYGFTKSKVEPFLIAIRELGAELTNQKCKYFRTEFTKDPILVCKLFIDWKS